MSPEMRDVLDGEVTTYIKVQKVDGRVLYYEIKGDVQTELDEETYYERGGE